MSPDERRLLRHLTTAVLIKLAVLMALWWFFVRDSRVDAGTEQTAEHMGATAPPQGVPQ